MGTVASAGSIVKPVIKKLALKLMRKINNSGS